MCQVACPKCNRKTRSKLRETRQGGADSIRRVRECQECGAHYTTYERVEEKRPLSLGECKDQLRIAYAALGRALEKMP